jgi:predicted DNA-binding protein
MEGASKMDAVRLNVIMPKALHRRAKIVAAAHGHKLSDIVRRAIEDYIEEMEDSELLNQIEARVAEGKERTYTEEEVWADLDELSA